MAFVPFGISGSPQGIVESPGESHTSNRTRGWNMICQHCLSAQATSRVIERATTREFVEYHYCQACCIARYLCPGSPRVRFPRPILNLRWALFLLAVFAIFNFLVILIARTVLIGTSAEYINEWVFNAILMVNVCLGIATANIFCIRWLRKVIWFRRTVALTSIPKPAVDYLSRRITMMFVAWYLSSLVVPACVCRLVLGRLEDNLAVYIPTCALLSPLFLLIVSNLSAYRPVGPLGKSAPFLSIRTAPCDEASILMSSSKARL